MFYFVINMEDTSSRNKSQAESDGLTHSADEISSATEKPRKAIPVDEKQSKEFSVSESLNKITGKILSVTKDTVSISIKKLSQGYHNLKSMPLFQEDASQADIPDALIILLQVVLEQNHFIAWFQMVRKMDAYERRNKIRGLVTSILDEGGSEKLAHALILLEDQEVFQAFVKALDQKS